MPTAPAEGLAALLGRLDQHGAVTVATQLGQTDRDLAYPDMLRHLQAAARVLLDI